MAVREDVAHVFCVSGLIDFGFGIVLFAAGGLTGGGFRRLLLVEAEGKPPLGLKVEGAGEDRRLAGLGWLEQGEHSLHLLLDEPLVAAEASMRMSRGPSAMKENPRSGRSNCMELTPRSSRTRSQQG